MEYWERIKALREENTYSQYENGKRDVPISVLIKLCRYYQVSADYILGLAEKK